MTKFKAEDIFIKDAYIIIEKDNKEEAEVWLRDNCIDHDIWKISVLEEKPKENKKSTLISLLESIDSKLDFLEEINFNTNERK